MSPDLHFILLLGFRMLVAAAFVVTASVVTERSGPVIGALIATLPISAGPSYVFSRSTIMRHSLPKARWRASPSTPPPCFSR